MKLSKKTQIACTLINLFLVSTFVFTFVGSAQSASSTATISAKPAVVPECLPKKYKFVSEIFKDNRLLKSFTRSLRLEFPQPGNYSSVQGITTFRGNNYRNTASYGYVNVKEKKLEKAWNIKISHIDSWTGVGWNGQPSIVKWDDNVKKIMNLYTVKKSKKVLKEVIYAALDGKIYFLDLDDGSATRPIINVGAPHKGSVTVDPRGYPLLYAGQGIDEVSGKKVEIGYRIFSLINQKKLYFFNGFDSLALRRWGAFDSNPLIDSKTDTMVLCGENGIMYTAKLNTKFQPEKGSIGINPEVIKYRYYSPKKSTVGVENSVAIHKSLAYFADNSGTLQCVDLNTLKPVWIRDVKDDTDSTIAIESISDTEVYLYTACEVDKQGKGGSSHIRKINALTGQELWVKSYKCFYDTAVNGGVLASPVLGQNQIDNLVIYNIAKTNDKNRGKMIAFDKKTGKEIWVADLVNYCWSSPVAVYTKEGTAYIIACDSKGNMMLFEGKTGKQLYKISLDANIEGSPAVYDNMIVVGTRGQKIFGIRIK